MPPLSLFTKAVAIAALISTLTSSGLAEDTTDGGSPRPVGVNLAPAVDYQSGWVFVDVMRTARPWIAQTTQAPGGPWDTGAAIELNADGWPARLDNGQAASTLMCREIDGRYPAGRYVCLYDGTGTVEFGFDAQTVTSNPGRIELEVAPTEAGIFMTIKATDPTDPVRNVRVVMPGHELTYQTQLFHPKFIESLEPFSVIRFMDWGSTNNSRVTSWSQRTTPTFYTQQSKDGVALELMVELCNTLNADGWFCVPHGADDDYVRRMAQTIAAHLEPGRRAHIEYSNEVWNGGFTQYKYALGKATELGLANENWTGVWRWTAQRSVEIFDIVDDVLSPDRLVRVLPGQAAVPDVLREIMSWNNAAAHADAIAIAPYFSGKGSDPAYYPEVLSWSVDRVLDEAGAHLVELAVSMRAHADLADSRGLELLGYEGGQHLAPIGGTPSLTDSNFQDLMTRANRHPRMKTLYYDYLLSWHESGGRGMCLFNHISESTKWGNWGLLEYQDQPWSEAPKWLGVVEYMIDYDAMNKGDDLAVTPDADGDGFLTNNDITVFIAKFVERDPSADYNQDGYLDLADLTAFVEAFLDAI